MPETKTARLQFRAALEQLLAPPPWNESDEPGEIVDARGVQVLVVDPNRTLPTAKAIAISRLVILCVNTCADFVAQLEQAPACRVCGCTDDRACPGGCSWVEPDLCSACAGESAEPPAIA